MNPNEYWEQSDISIDQKFYIAFCILASACSDHAIGADLRLRKKLNWASTVLYYSLVHAGRLICFIESGDFPTGHTELSDLFRRGNIKVGNSWVSKKLKPHENRIEPITDFSNTIFSQDIRQNWGQILTNARELRDDANYEGLLISHEYSHQKVTQYFNSLAEALNTASEQQIPSSIQVFLTFIENSPRKEHWYSFLNWKKGHESIFNSANREPLGEGLYYLEASMRYRNIEKDIIKKVTSWLKCMYREPDQNIELASEVHSHIVMSAFALKSTLFNEFDGKISRLISILHSNQDS